MRKNPETSGAGSDAPADTASAVTEVKQESETATDARQGETVPEQTGAGATGAEPAVKANADSGRIAELEQAVATAKAEAQKAADTAKADAETSKNAIAALTAANTELKQKIKGHEEDVEGIAQTLRVRFGDVLSEGILDTAEPLVLASNILNVLDIPEESASDRAPLRRLREFALRVGAAIAGLFTVDEAETAIAEAGADPAEAAVAPAGPFWELASDYVGDGPASATDPEGNWAATVYNDGRAEITRFAAPNLHNRRPGTVAAGDVTLGVDSLSDAIARLTELRDVCDPVFEASLTRLAQERDEERARLEEAEAATEEATVVQEDPDDVVLAEAAAEFGLVGTAPERLPYKIAEALGIEVRAALANDDGPVLDRAGNQVYGGEVDFESARALVLAKLKE